ALIEHETIEGKHVMEILRHGEIKSPVINAPAPVRAGGKPAETKPADKPATDSFGGSTAPAPTPA
ncbi:MAG: hypothetical protein LBC18_02985, partial [Opitutaceae bacterium]|nr:hypothetical protein [Opitutaceae bacterium]